MEEARPQPGPEMSNPDFTFIEKNGLGVSERAAFDENGFVFLRGLLTNEEVNKLRAALQHKNGVMSKSSPVPHDINKTSHVVRWAQPGSDVTGMVARSEKSVQVAETLLGGEVYHYYAKAMSKMPKASGFPDWHQDYGYWYHNGLFLPSVGTLWIAIDKSTKENGCMQFLRGSHTMGRIDLQQPESKGRSSPGAGGLGVPDPARVELAKKVFKQVNAEAEPGDAIFFHCNVLHKSDPNETSARKMAYLITYSRVNNGLDSEHPWRNHEPMEKVSHSAIINCENITDLEEKGFMDPRKRYSASSRQNAAQPDTKDSSVVNDEQKLLRSHWIEY